MRRKNLIIACPVCGKRVEWDRSPERPFCSERCRLIDLGRWADETYRIAGEKAPEPDGATVPLPNEDL